MPANFRFLILLLFACTQFANAETVSLQLPPYKKSVLANGLTILLMEQHEVPLISFSFTIKTGSVADPAGKEGVAAMTAALLRKGTHHRTADEFSRELDFIGGTFSAGAGLDSSSGAAEFLKKDIGKGLDLLADALLDPIFPAEEFEKLRKQRADGIKSAKDRAQAVLGSYFDAYLFGSHPYGRPEGGDERSLAALTREDVARYYDNNYTPNNLILAVVGDFETAAMEKILTDRFRKWSSKPVSIVPIPEPDPVAGKRLLLVDKKDSTQTYFRIGNVGIARTNADRVLIRVVNTLFGGRFTSMLNSELRIKTGLTYGASSSFAEQLRAGAFVISTYTKNAETARAMDLTLATLKRLHDEGITAEELASAKAYLKGQFPPHIETSDQLARLIAELEFYGLDASEINTFYAKIDAMTLPDAQRIIHQYFPLENLVFAVIGKASEIESVVAKYAPKIDKKSISDPGF